MALFPALADRLARLHQIDCLKVAYHLSESIDRRLYCCLDLYSADSHSPRYRKKVMLKETLLKLANKEQDFLKSKVQEESQE